MAPARSKKAQALSSRLLEWLPDGFYESPDHKGQPLAATSRLVSLFILLMTFAAVSFVTLFVYFYVEDTSVLTVISGTELEGYTCTMMSRMPPRTVTYTCHNQSDPSRPLPCMSPGSNFASKIRLLNTPEQPLAQSTVAFSYINSVHYATHDDCLAGFARQCAVAPSSPRLLTGTRRMLNLGIGAVRPPVTAANAVIVLSERGVLSAIASISGKTLWAIVPRSQPLPAGGAFAAESPDIEVDGSSLFVAALDDTVVVADGNVLQAFDIQSGNRQWATAYSIENGYLSAMEIGPLSEEDGQIFYAVDADRTKLLTMNRHGVVETRHVKTRTNETGLIVPAITSRNGRVVTLFTAQNVNGLFEEWISVRQGMREVYSLYLDTVGPVPPWYSDPNSPLPHKAALGLDETAYVVGLDGVLHATDAGPDGRGRILWRFPSESVSQHSVTTPPTEASSTVPTNNSTSAALTSSMTAVPTEPQTNSTSESPIDLLSGLLLYGTPALTRGTVVVTGVVSRSFGFNPISFKFEYIVGVNQVTGKVMWSFEMSVGSSKSSVTSPVVGPDGCVYLADMTGRIVALSSQGELIFSTHTVAKFRLTPVVDSSGILYAQATSGSLYNVLPSNSFATLTMSIRFPIHGGFAIRNNGEVLVTSFSTVVSMDHSGQELWIFEANAELFQPHVIMDDNDDGIVLVATLHGSLFLIDPINGDAFYRLDLDPQMCDNLLSMEVFFPYVNLVCAGGIFGEIKQVAAYVLRYYWSSSDGSYFDQLVKVGGGDNDPHFFRPTVTEGSLRGVDVPKTVVVYFSAASGCAIAALGPDGRTVYESFISATWGEVAVDANLTLYYVKDSTLYYYPVTGNISQLYDSSRSYSLPCDPHANAAPVVGHDSYLYVTCPNMLVTVDTKNWKTRTSIISGNADLKPVIGDDGTVYVGGTNTKFVFAFTADGGQLKWRFTAETLYSSLGVDSTGLVYIASYDRIDVVMPNVPVGQAGECYYPPGNVAGGSNVSLSAGVALPHGGKPLATARYCATTWRSVFCDEDSYLYEYMRDSYCIGFAKNQLPPYSCTREVRHSILESLSLAYSAATLVYAIAFGAVIQVSG